MKHLTLIRHAKSSHDNGLIQDFMRPLSGRGLQDAPLIGRHLKTTFDFAPDAFICSPALRTRTTADIIAREAGLTLTLQEEPRIYEAPVSALAAIIRTLPDSVSHAALCGHNPGLELLANWLCGKRVITGLRTGGVILLELKLDSWQTTGSGSAALLTYFYPSLIGGGKEVYGGG